MSEEPQSKPDTPAVPEPAETPASRSEGTGNQNIGLKLDTENLIETYHVVAEWIRFADAKAAVVLTAAGAAVSVVVPTVREYLARDAASHPTAWWTYLVLAAFGLALLVLVLACISAFACILPFRLRGRHPSLDLCTHFHPAAISARYGIEQHEQFVAGYRRAGVEGFQAEVLAGLLVDAHISSAKYKHVTRSIKLLAVSAALGVVYLATSQF